MSTETICREIHIKHRMPGLCRPFEVGPLAGLYGKVVVLARRDGPTTNGFSITLTSPDVFGAAHAIIAKVRGMDRFVRLHLADLDGVPMHAVENGVYWMSGALDDVLDGAFRFTPTDETACPRRTPVECAAVAREHFRMTEEEMASFTAGARARLSALGKLVERRTLLRGALVTELRMQVQALVTELAPRWKAEADEALRVLAAMPPVSESTGIIVERAAQ